VKIIEHSMFELPVKSTAKTGCEVNQSGSYSPFTHVTVVPCPQARMPLNDTNSSIIEPDSSNSELFEGVNGTGVGAPSSGESEVDGFSGGALKPRTEDKKGEILYTNLVPVELPQSGIQPHDTPNRPAWVAAKPSRFRDDRFEKVREVGLGLGKGEPTAVQQEEQPHMKSKTPAGHRCQALGKGELNRITQCNSKSHGSVKDSLIQPHNDSSHYLLRKRGHRLGWPTWPKVRFKSHVQNQWKPRFRTLSRRSVRFKPPTGSCKLSRDTYRVRTLNRRRVIRFRTHYRPLRNYSLTHSRTIGPGQQYVKSNSSCFAPQKWCLKTH